MGPSPPASLFLGLVGSLLVLLAPNGAHGGSCFCTVKVYNSNSTCGGLAFGWRETGEKDGGCAEVSASNAQSWKFSDKEDCKKGHFHFGSSTCGGTSVAVANNECKPFSVGKSVFVSNCGEDTLEEDLDDSSTSLLIIIILIVVAVSSSVALCIFCCMRRQKQTVIVNQQPQPGMQPMPGQVMAQPPYNGQQQYPTVGTPTMVQPVQQGLGPQAHGTGK